MAWFEKLALRKNLWVKKVQSQVNRRKLLNALLVAGLSLHPEMTLSQDVKSPLNCDCSETVVNTNCGDCGKICEMRRPFNEALKIVNKRCEERGKKLKTEIYDGTVGLLELKGVLGDLQKTAAKKGSPDLKEDCAACAKEERLDVNVNPHKFKENSCPDKYIKTHSFQEKISLKEKGQCSDSGYMEKVYQATSKYVQSLLSEPADLTKSPKDMNPVEKMWHECPSECSFYITYSVMTVRELCDNFLDVKIHCSHRRAGLFGGKYNVKVNHITEVKCGDSPLLKKK